MSFVSQSQLSVTNQPQANLNLGSLDFKQSIPVHEKSLDASLEDSHHHHCEHGQTSEHHSCHNIRLRRLLLPAIVTLLALGGLLAWSCVNWQSMPAWGVDLVGRALNDNSTSSQSPFIRNKLWLIVLLVGLVVVFILGVMLSFWCCKGAFENPLCCPCYLCACCGGIACLECILCCGVAEAA